MLEDVEASKRRPRRVHVGARVDQELADQFALAARLRDVAQSHALRDAMRAYVTAVLDDDPAEATDS